MTIYRGVSNFQEQHKNKLYHPDIQFALQFTQSGRPGEVIKAEIADDSVVALPTTPYGGDDEEMSEAIEYAKQNGIDAFWVDEGSEEPSVMIMRSAIMNRSFRISGRCTEKDCSLLESILKATKLQ